MPQEGEKSMAINLLNIEPHKVSKDLSGYITYIYGAPKTR